MPPKKNPLKLNKLQLRTLMLLQVLANDEGSSKRDEATGEVAILSLPNPHGNHFHVGKFVVAASDASGFNNPAVWLVLERKNLVRKDDAFTVTVTTLGLEYGTGLGHQFMAESDH